MSVSTLKSQRRIVLPKDVCDKLDLQEGDAVAFTFKEGFVCMENKKAVLKRIQSDFAKLPKVSLVEDLRRERQWEFNKEMSELENP